MERLREIIRKYWGYDGFRPLQREAMESVLVGRDSLVVLPTGGGKSLCFQAPAVAMEGTALVVSPLISLMKDQVDTLQECGVSAACLHSNLTVDERYSAMTALRTGTLDLLYVSPERLFLGEFMESLTRGNISISFVAIDEVHCVSMWGHDFRPEYRRLKSLHDALPGVPIHGYTATATEQVRDDIVEQLGLRDPSIVVGSFDRPNLVYRIERRRRRREKIDQILEVVNRHRGESGIIYCISRKDTEKLTEDLNASGCRAVAYHAGLDGETRHAAQEAFVREDIDIVVATVAFGMGIDKSNVRYVIHAAMPKSLEHYQQESGRAGRDGLEAECCLFYSMQDYQTWRRLMQPGEVSGAAMDKLDDMLGFCTGVGCRHAALLEYFGQRLEGDGCEACDICLGDVELIHGEEAWTLGRKILSCVARLKNYYGASYVANVLIGSRNRRIVDAGHDKLSTHGLLSKEKPAAIRDWIEQLKAQGYLRTEPEFQTVAVTSVGMELLRSDTPEGANGLTFRRPPAPVPVRHKARAEKTNWQGVDAGLFEALRSLRHDLAHERDIAPFMVFPDASLRDMARRRPSTTAHFLAISGVGEVKCETYGEVFLKTIGTYCETHALEQELMFEESAPRPPAETRDARRALDEISDRIQIPAGDLDDDALFEHLRDLRTAEAKRRRTQAYKIFTDATLEEMSRRRPANEEEFLEIKGVGSAKCRKFGELFLNAINTGA